MLLHSLDWLPWRWETVTHLHACVRAVVRMWVCVAELGRQQSQHTSRHVESKGLLVRIPASQFMHGRHSLTKASKSASPLVFPCRIFLESIWHGWIVLLLANLEAVWSVIYPSACCLPAVQLNWAANDVKMEWAKLHQRSCVQMCFLLGETWACNLLCVGSLKPHYVRLKVELSVMEHCKEMFCFYVRGSAFCVVLKRYRPNQKLPLSSAWRSTRSKQSS